MGVGPQEHIKILEPISKTHFQEKRPTTIFVVGLNYFRVGAIDVRLIPYSVQGRHLLQQIK